MISLLSPNILLAAAKGYISKYSNAEKLKDYHHIKKLLEDTQPEKILWMKMIRVFQTTLMI